MVNISSHDMDQIKSFRAKVADIVSPYYDTDFNLLRWLKAFNYDFNEALLKLRKHLVLRKSNWQLDTIVQEQRDHPIHQHWQITITGNAVKTENVIVCIEQTGNVDYWGMLHTYPMNEILKAFFYKIELMLQKIMELEMKTGEQTSILYIMDLSGLNFDAQLLEILSRSWPGIAEFVSENYVEIIHSFIIVNAPIVLSTIWAIVSPFLPLKTKNKVKILGSNWQNEILEMVNPNILPTCWNESGKEPIFLTNLPSCLPCSVDSYYKGDQLNDSSEVLWVSPGKTGCIDIEAKKNSLLKWIYETDGHFAIGIFFTEDRSESNLTNMKPIYPIAKKIPGPTYVPIQESMVCQHSGVYKFWFSNEHAWLHTLKVRYIIDVKEQ